MSSKKQLLLEREVETIKRRNKLTVKQIGQQIASAMKRPELREIINGVFFTGPVQGEKRAARAFSVWKGGNYTSKTVKLQDLKNFAHALKREYAARTTHPMESEKGAGEHEVEGGEEKDDGMEEEEEQHEQQEEDDSGGHSVFALVSKCLSRMVVIDIHPF